MSFLLSFLGIILGIIVAFIIIVFIIYIKIRNTIGKANMDSLVEVAKNSKDLLKEEYTRPKNVKGLTKLLEPEIIRDFSDFNKNVLYDIIEQNLTKIFNAISKKSYEGLENDSDLVLIYPIVQKQIEDIKSRNIDIKYSDVVFNEHSICNYEKIQGMATITTSTTVGYYYSNSENKDDSEYNNIKKQTRYTCKFVYIYDEEKMGRNKQLFSIHCPNCGAPLSQFGDEVVCEYCSSHVKSINLKLWKMSSYKEDY